MSEQHHLWIPIKRSIESEGKKYVYGYAAIFDSPDAFGTVMTKQVVLDSLEHLTKFPAVRFMHREPLGQIVFDREVDGVKTFVDEHGFHVLCEIYPSETDKWKMVKAGGWGFSFGFMPDPNTTGFEQINGVPHFAHGKVYEISVVDVPAHQEAVATAIERSLGIGNPQPTHPERLGFTAMLEEAFSIKRIALPPNINYVEQWHIADYPEQCSDLCKYARVCRSYPMNVGLRCVNRPLTNEELKKEEST